MSYHVFVLFCFAFLCFVVFLFVLFFMFVNLEFLLEILKITWNAKYVISYQKIINYLIMKPCGAFYRPNGNAEPVSWVVCAE